MNALETKPVKFLRRARHGFYLEGLDAWICPDGYRESTPTSWRVEWRVEGEDARAPYRRSFRKLADARVFALTLGDVAGPREWSN
jgi:hypothetical protein